MSDNVLLTEESVEAIQQHMDEVSNFALNTGRAPLSTRSATPGAMLRGYLMQGVSRGQMALCALVSRRPEYRCFKIDLAGVIYTNYPTGDSRFQLRFYKDGATWFDTAILDVDNLTAGALLEAISYASADPNTGDQQLPTDCMVAALGHPTQHTNMQPNDELYPAIPSTYQPGDLIDSKIGSWVFGIHNASLPDGFDVDLLFSFDADDPVQLAGPGVMTLYEVYDVPTGEIIVVTDVMEVASPSPLRGGTKIVVGFFDDVGYGIVSAHPREYLFEQDYV
jgi:hypothetical protein